MTISGPCASSPLHEPVDVEGSALAKANSRKGLLYRGKNYLMYKLVALALSTCGERIVEAHRVFKSLAKRRARKYRLTFTTAGEAGLIARDTGALRREVSMTLQDTLSYRTRECLEKQTAARRSRVDPGRSPATKLTAPRGGVAKTASKEGRGGGLGTRYWGSSRLSGL